MSTKKYLWELTEEELQSGKLTVANCERCRGTGRYHRDDDPDDAYDYTCSCVSQVVSSFQNAAFPECFADQTLASITADPRNAFRWEWVEPEETRANLRAMAGRLPAFLAEGEGAVLSGGAGSGKTRAAIGLAKIACGYGMQVTFCPAADLLEELRDAIGAHRETGRLLEDLYDCDLLVLDDLGLHVDSSWVRERLYLVANNRMLRRKATIVTTNFTARELAERFGDGIVSRLAGRGMVMTFEGADYRCEVERKEDLARLLQVKPVEVMF